MEKIASFTIDHLKLSSGIYVSRVDERDGVKITTFDLRITMPNREPVIDTPALHTIEHLGATFLRNSNKKDDIVYFGPMGCRTGCYLLVFGEKSSEDIYPLILELCDFIMEFEGEIPGAKPEECGNFSEQNLMMAKYYMAEYKKRLIENKSFEYNDCSLSKR
ncbi:MAG: S-ribosylhomocysteine lyase [Clostridia bacterium]|nr:S-ribosylhomocysteine lyase [Clostridia bacterium]